MQVSQMSVLFLCTSLCLAQTQTASENTLPEPTSTSAGAASSEAASSASTSPPAALTSATTTAIEGGNSTTVSATPAAEVAANTTATSANVTEVTTDAINVSNVTNHSSHTATHSVPATTPSSHVSTSSSHVTRSIRHNITTSSSNATPNSIDVTTSYSLTSGGTAGGTSVSHINNNWTSSVAAVTSPTAGPSVATSGASDPVSSSSTRSPASSASSVTFSSNQTIAYSATTSASGTPVVATSAHSSAPPAITTALPVATPEPSSVTQGETQTTSAAAAAQPSSVTSPPLTTTSQPAGRVTTLSAEGGRTHTSTVTDGAAVVTSVPVTSLPSVTSGQTPETPENVTEQGATMQYYGYPKSITESKMGDEDLAGVVTLTLEPVRMELLTWLAVKESHFRDAILNMTAHSGFATSKLEWIYVSPAPVLQPLRILLSFLVRWRGGTPNISVETSPDAGTHSESGHSTTTSSSLRMTSARSPVTSGPDGKRRRRREAEQSGTVPASLLRDIIQHNSVQLAAASSSRLVSVSAGLPARRASLCQGEHDRSQADSNLMMLIITAAAGVCLCLTCGALLYVRLIRSSGHWDPRPAYHQGERVSGVDLNTDATCKKGEQPLDDAGDVYPLSSLNNTPRNSVRGGRNRAPQPPTPSNSVRGGRNRAPQPPTKNV